MRTLVAVLLLAIAVTVCHAEEPKQVQYGVVLDTSRVNLGQQVDAVAEALKKHMEGPLGMYYQAAVKKNAVGGKWAFWCGFGMCVGGIMCCVVGAALDYGNCNPDHIMIPGVLLTVAGAIMLGCSITPYFCPEYAAMREMIEQLGAVIK
jgi:hypothetical protein